MDRTITSISIAVAFAVAHYSASVLAVPTESCFQSKEDYEVYKLFGDGQPVYPDPLGYPYPVLNFGKEKMIAIEKAVQHGPAKRKEIIINTTSKQTDRMITIDASGSTTPSGNKEFAWGNDPTKFRAEDSNVSTQVSGGSGSASILLIVRDPVCERTASKQVSASYN
ncbi:hypothetical protein [Pseudomonas japonica]|uniref:hypothetical protein n=1 Tax=Pseudomonas japonica TaxID=256466 RepID=UPI0005A883BC|nr:hypothetical protein [Pseudomonas japonica]